jgi:hypothetical protein
MKNLFRLYDNASVIFIVATGLLLSVAAFYFIHWKTPAFYWKLDERITSNKALMSKIGGWKQIQFKYSDSLATNNSFRITVVGECDSASIIIRGFYDDDKYTIRDTILHECK